MSQQYVDAYFNTRKRTAAEDVRSRTKVLILDDDQAVNVASNLNDRNVDETKNLDSLASPAIQGDDTNPKMSPKIIFANVDSKQIEGCEIRSSVVRPNRVVRNIQFDAVKAGSPKSPKSSSRSRSGARMKKTATQEGQPDIRDTFLKLSKDEGEAKQKSNVIFEKKGLLSPTKKRPSTPQKVPQHCAIQKVTNTKAYETAEEQPAAGSVTPKKLSTMDALAQKDLSLGEIKNRINRSSRLAELKASIAKINKCAAKLGEIQAKKPQIRKFENIEVEVPVSPQKAMMSPKKNVLTPTKNVELPKNASPQKRLLFAPKESSGSPSKSPTKQAAYQKYQSLVESGTPTLLLPYNYRLLAEAFRCVDTVVSLLFNRKEVITFKKLKPAVQELLRRNFTMDHLAQIKTVYPNAFVFNQEKLHNFGSSSKQDKYELVITPMVEPKIGRNTPDADNVLKSASEMSMCPTVLLQRRRIFYNTLLDLVKDCHEKYLLSLKPPMVIPKEKLTRWHPEFDVESCATIEKAELPQPPNIEKFTTAKDVLQKAKDMFNCNTRMEKALQRLAEAKMTSRSGSPSSTLTVDVSTQINDQEMRKVNISIVDTPPATPTHNSYLSTAFKGIPKALLEKVRAKQAAKALESMTRTSDSDKEATQYSRLPELSRILRNIFVAEKKGVLPMEFVIKKLDNSYRAKLTPNELEDLIKLMCKLLPVWASIQKVQKTNYLKLTRDIDVNKVVRRFEIMANNKVNAS
ncbi:DNA replication factor Cdt1 [Neodiprion lecontei]|uniref:DNA replication factor Cdt1 n=1 Tax=Neodiprion lecontei TaxID=441921 RepID=A0A6J0C751_NEOLC|nr:DNA replication factor Cdt1 [Neodiprion lecontei]